MSSIISRINIETTKGTNIDSLVIRDKKYEGGVLRFGGEELAGGENYFVGTPNYIKLGIKKDEFLDPDGSEYIIGVTTRDGGKYQVLSFIETSSYKKVSIRGNYQAGSGDTEGLIFINGLVQTN